MTNVTKIYKRQEVVESYDLSLDLGQHVVAEVRDGKIFKRLMDKIVFCT